MSGEGDDDYVKMEQIVLKKTKKILKKIIIVMKTLQKKEK